MAGPFFSTQLTNVNNTVVNQPGQLGGDGFIIPWTYTTAGGGGPAPTEIVYLTNIPEGFYVAGIHVNSGTLGGTAQGQFGDDDNTTRYSAAIGVQSLNQFIVLAATGYLFRNDKFRQFRVTAQNAAWAASQQFNGFVLGFRDA